MTQATTLFDTTAEDMRDAYRVFDTVGHIDSDEALRFQLRGNAYNPLVDAAMPLFGLIIRLRSLDSYTEVNRLYLRVSQQIAVIDEEVRQKGYDPTVQLTFRYVLCATVDEAVMTTPWGASSSWSVCSLLSQYHEETWAGDKFFTLLTRMMSEPVRYRELLECMYLSLSLGFKGRYTLRPQGEEDLRALLVNLRRVLREQRGDIPERWCDAYTNVAPRNYRFRRQWSWWVPWLATGAALAIAFGVYRWQLSLTTDEVLRALDGLLTR